MGREGRGAISRRLGAAAAAVALAGTLSLPFAGTLGEPREELTTVGTPDAALRRTGRSAAVTPGELALAAAVPAQAPPPAPPPHGGRIDPDVGAAGSGGRAATGGDVAGTIPTAPGLSGVPLDAPGRRVWAVVVGIDDYPGERHDLRSATADARDLVVALLRVGVPPDQVLALYDQAATSDAVLGAVDWLVANADAEDTVVFLYAGHVRELDPETEAMVTADAGWITDWYLADRFAPLRSRDAWFVLAACYGGGFDELLGPGRVVTAAAGPDELAYESDGYGRSYLAEFLLRRALVEARAGDPTVQGAVAWATAQLAEHHPNRQIWSRDEAGHVISLDGIRREAAPAPVPEPDPAPPTPAPGGLLDVVIGGGGGGGGGGDGPEQPGQPEQPAPCPLTAALLGTCRDD